MNTYNKYIKNIQSKKYKSILNIFNNQRKRKMSIFSRFIFLSNQIDTNLKDNTEKLNKLLSDIKKVQNIYFKELLLLKLNLKYKRNDLFVINSVVKLLNIRKIFFVLNPLPFEKKIVLTEFLRRSLVELKPILNKKLVFLFKSQCNLLYPTLNIQTVDYSLNDLRDMANSSIDGIPNAQLWVQILKDRVSSKELKLYINKYFENMSLDENISNSYLLLNYLDHIPLKIRNNFIKYFKNKSSDYSKIYLLEIMNNSNENIVSNQILKLKKPLSLYKRNFFKHLLKKSLAKEYALYNLIRLGDLDFNYLLWLTIE